MGGGVSENGGGGRNGKRSESSSEREEVGPDRPTQPGQWAVADHAADIYHRNSELLAAPLTVLPATATQSR